MYCCLAFSSLLSLALSLSISLSKFLSLSLCLSGFLWFTHSLSLIVLILLFSLVFSFFLSLCLSLIYSFSHSLLQFSSIFAFLSLPSLPPSQKPVLSISCFTLSLWHPARTTTSSTAPSYRTSLAGNRRTPHDKYRASTPHPPWWELGLISPTKCWEHRWLFLLREQFAELLRCWVFLRAG